MIAVNLRDGTTRKFDLADEAARGALNELGKDAKDVTGLWILGDQKATLPMPTRFRRVSFYCEFEGGVAKLVVRADDTLVTVTARPGGNPLRVDLHKVGRRRVYAPEVTA